MTTLATLRGGPYRDVGQGHAKGAVRVVLNGVPDKTIRDPAGRTIWAGDVTVPIVDGLWELQVPPSDDPTLSVWNFSYVVVEQLENVPPANRRVMVVEAPSGATVDMADVESTIAPTPVLAQPVTGPEFLALGAKVTAAEAGADAALQLAAVVEAEVKGRLSEAALSASIAHEVGTPGTPAHAELTATIAAVTAQFERPELRSAIARQMPRFLRKAARNEPVTIAIHSASICSGYNVNGNFAEGVYQADPAGTGRQMIARLVAKYGLTNVTVVNAGVAGIGARDLVQGGKGNDWVLPLERLVDLHAPDLVIGNVNTNDSTSEGATAEQFEARYVDWLREARRLSVEMLVVPPFTHYGGGNPTLVAAAYRALERVGVQPIPVESAIENPAAPGTILPGLSGSGNDGTHPNATGAALIGAAFGACLPDLASAKVAVQNVAPAAGTWDSPHVAGRALVWSTDTGARRRSAAAPINEADGVPYSHAPAVPAAVTMRHPLAVYDLAQGADSGVLYDKSGHGLNGTLGADAARPTWAPGGGLTFDGGDWARIPMDALGRLKLTPGADTFTVRVVAQAAAPGTTQTILGRRGDAGTGSSAPFAVFLSGGKVSVFERGSTRATTVDLSTGGLEDWVFSSRAGEPNIVAFRNGAHVATMTTHTGSGANADPFDGDDSGRPVKWDFLLGGRFAGSDPAAASVVPQFVGTIQWVEIARSFVSPIQAGEVAAKHAALKAHLAERSLTWAT